jgi:hypothetical protein
MCVNIALVKEGIFVAGAGFRLHGFRGYQIVAGIVFRAHVQVESSPQFSAPLDQFDRTKVVLVREPGILKLKRSVVKITLSIQMLLHDVQ